MRCAEAASHPADAGYGVPSVHASISDNYAQAVKAGFIQPVCGYVHSGSGRTLHIAPSSVRSGAVPTTTLEDIDDVILCTGFTAALDYLDADLRDTIGLCGDTLQPLLLHKDVMHPDLPGAVLCGHVPRAVLRGGRASGGECSLATLCSNVTVV
jgi:hypothetical protein